MSPRVGTRALMTRLTPAFLRSQGIRSSKLVTPASSLFRAGCTGAISLSPVADRFSLLRRTTAGRSNTFQLRRSSTTKPASVTTLNSVSRVYLRTCDKATSCDDQSVGSAGTVMNAVPPGRSVRAISFAARKSSSMCSRTSMAMTASSDASLIGSWRASARMAMNPRARATESPASEYSAASTRQPSSRKTRPFPPPAAPTSTTRPGGSDSKCARRSLRRAAYHQCLSSRAVAFSISRSSTNRALQGVASC